MEEEIKSSSEKLPEQVAKTYSEQEYNALKIQLDTAKNDVADYKQKWEQSENDRKAFEHRTKLNQYVKNLRLKDDVYEEYVAKLLEEKGLKFDGEKLIGGDDIVNDFRKNHADAFLPDVSERVSGQTSGKAPHAMNAVEQAFYAKNPHLFHEN